MDSQFNKRRVKKFLSYYRPHRRIFIMDMFFAGLSAASVLMFPLASGYIAGEVLSEWNDGTVRKLIGAGLVLLLLTAVRIAANVTYAYFGHAMGAKMEGAMRDELLRHYEELSFDFHSNNSVGKLMTVVSNDLTEMTEFFHHGPEDILMTAIKFIGAFVILININAILTLILFMAMPLLFFCALKTNKLMENALVRNKADLSGMNEHLEDILAGIRTVKAFGNEAVEAEAFSGQNQKYTRSKCAYYKIEACFYETVKSYPQLLTMLTVLCGALLLGRGALDAAVLITFLLYVGSLAEPVMTILGFMKLYEKGKTSFIRFMHMMETEPEVREAQNAVQIQDFKGDIRFENVSFGYGASAERVLDNVSFHIESGQSVSFVGASGIGKTTVSMLIARFYDVTEGRILIDNVDIRDIPSKTLRENVGIVQQEVYIFNGTVRDNILVGKRGASDEEVIRAARLADIHDFICSLPDGYSSVVGTKGIMLSGGQRQRISLARLFLKNPRVLILDEATSALDYESEKAVQKAVEALTRGRTSIIIAHRLSTIKNSDNIMVMADRHIVEQGTHAGLTAQNGEYAKLCSLGNL